jgi:hypothetical protein
VKKRDANLQTYKLTKENKIIGAAEIFECGNDEAAIERAKQQASGRDIELWEGSRLVTYLRRLRMNYFAEGITFHPLAKAATPICCCLDQRRPPMIFRPLLSQNLAQSSQSFLV